MGPVVASEPNAAERLAIDLAERLGVAWMALKRFDATHKAGALPDVVLGAVFEAALRSYPEAMTHQPTRPSGPAAKVTAGGEDKCACCDPPVPLSVHTHAPVKDVGPPSQQEVDLTPSGVVQYQPRVGEARDVLLGSDMRVLAKVTGRTFEATDTLRKAGLTWNEKQGQESGWMGRAGPTGLRLLGALDDGEGIRVEIMEGLGDSPPQRAPKSQAPRQGRDFY